MINLANNRETCGQLPQIRTYYGPSENRVALRIDLDPRRYENTRVIFIVTYAERTPRNLSVHLGDSQYNSGEGGDSRNQPFNAELIIDDYQLTVFGDRDMRRENVQVLGEYPDFISAGSIVVFEISDQQVRWVNETEGEQITSPKLYALGGQNKGDYQIFAAFNRGIALGGARDGSGVERVEIWLFPPRP